MQTSRCQLGVELDVTEKNPGFKHFIKKIGEAHGVVANIKKAKLPDFAKVTLIKGVIIARISYCLECMDLSDKEMETLNTKFRGILKSLFNIPSKCGNQKVENFAVYLGVDMKVIWTIRRTCFLKKLIDLHKKDRLTRLNWDQSNCKTTMDQNMSPAPALIKHLNEFNESLPKELRSLISPSPFNLICNDSRKRNFQNRPSPESSMGKRQPVENKHEYVEFILEGSTFRLKKEIFEGLDSNIKEKCEIIMTEDEFNTWRSGNEKTDDQTKITDFLMSENSRPYKDTQPPELLAFHCPEIRAKGNHPAELILPLINRYLELDIFEENRKEFIKFTNKRKLDLVTIIKFYADIASTPRHDKKAIKSIMDECYTCGKSNMGLSAKVHLLHHHLPFYECPLDLKTQSMSIIMEFKYNPFELCKKSGQIVPLLTHLGDFLTDWLSKICMVSYEYNANRKTKIATHHDIRNLITKMTNSVFPKTDKKEKKAKKGHGRTKFKAPQREKSQPIKMDSTPKRKADSISGGPSTQKGRKRLKKCTDRSQADGTFHSQ